MALVWAISASFLVSIISFIGIFALLIKEEALNKILIVLIGFSAGGLIGGAFLHLLPEALEISSGLNPFIYVILGLSIFCAPLLLFGWKKS